MAIDRHISFFEFRKACAQPGCPLCRIIADRAVRYIDNMLFEHVSDRGFRAAFRAAGGFCNFHARHLESFRDGLAVAILDRDILEDELTAFKARKKRKPRGSCPVCEERDRIENEYLSFLREAGGESPEERELRGSVTASSGLCVPHYGKLLQTGGRVPSGLREFHESRFEALLLRTSRFIEFSAYGRQDEFAALSPEDQMVWKELAASLRGGER
jgi:hypothetical protein